MKQNKVGSFILILYTHIRRLSSTIFKYFFELKYKAPDIDMTNYLKLSEKDYRNTIMEMPYLSEKFKGLFDFTLSPKYFLYKDLPHSRDCDDFAYMWNLYLPDSHIYFIMPELNFYRSHAICIVEKEYFIIYDYEKTYMGTSLENVLSVYCNARYSNIKSLSWAKYL